MLLQRKKDEAILPSFTELFLCCCCLCVCVCVSGLGLVVFFFFMFFFCDVIIGFFISKMGRNSAWETPDFYGWPVSLKKKEKKNHLVDERTSVPEFIQRKIWKFRFFFSCPFIVCVCVESFERKKNDSIFGRRNHQRNEIIFRKSSKKMWSSFFLKKRKWFSISKKKNNRRIANEIEWGGRGLPLFKKKKKHISCPGDRVVLLFLVFLKGSIEKSCLTEFLFYLIFFIFFTSFRSG